MATKNSIFKYPENLTESNIINIKHLESYNKFSVDLNGLYEKFFFNILNIRVPISIYEVNSKKCNI